MDCWYCDEFVQDPIYIGSQVKFIALHVHCGARIAKQLDKNFRPFPRAVA